MTAAPQTFMPAPLITLLTDFGEGDAFVGILKGALLSRLPEARLVDLSHQPPSGDAAADRFRAALLLRRVYSYYPAGTLHLVGQDAGDGSGRALLAQAGGQTFLAADTGVLGLVLEREPEARVFAGRPPEAMAPATFLARDVLVDWAARLASGIPPEELAPPAADWRRLHLPQPVWESATLRGQVLHVDTFGNVLTNFTPASLPGAWTWRQLEIAGAAITTRHDAYAHARPGELFLIWGAEGWLEISLRNASAARCLGVRPGTEVVLR